jgi:hypothetical protein
MRAQTTLDFATLICFNTLAEERGCFVGDYSMKKLVLASAVAVCALYLPAAQAAPIAANPAAVQDQVSSNVEKVWHCRAWSGGWGCGRAWGWGGGWGWHNRWRSHYRWGSRGW